MCVADRQSSSFSRNLDLTQWRAVRFSNVLKLEATLHLRTLTFDVACVVRVLSPALGHCLAELGPLLEYQGHSRVKSLYLRRS